MKREDQIERILTYLTFAETWVMEVDQYRDMPKSQLQYIALPLTYFNGAEVHAFDFNLGTTMSYERQILDPEHEENRELLTMDIGLWNTCMLGLPIGDTPERAGTTCLYHIGRFRKMPLSEVRGMFRLHTGDFVEWSQAWIYNDGKYQTCREIIERWTATEWWTVGQPLRVRPNRNEQVERGIAAAKSMAFTSYYDWRVEIGFETPGRTTLPTVSIATDPASAKTIYRLRDVPPGKSRRDALRHWVATHFRSSPYDHAEQIKIWAHLRGVEEFSHNGMKCRIVPSAFDLKKAAEYQRLSKEQKAATHRNVS